MSVQPVGWLAMAPEANVYVALPVVETPGALLVLVRW